MAEWTTSYDYIDENGTLAPVSLYAQTKVQFERYLLSRPHSTPCKPTCMRFSTVYGLSPRIRFDLTVNEFTKELKLGRKLVVFGEHFWRPYCHVNDIVEAIITITESAASKVGFEVFNIGNTKENYTKQMIVEEILRQIPSGKVEYVAKNEDPRDYKVSFEKIKKVLAFDTKRTISDGIREIIKLLELGLINYPEDTQYYNT